MALDFSKLKGGSSLESEPNPVKLFSLLPNKDPRYQYLRDVQSEVLKQWFEKRNEPFNVIKMNTGSGKTIVGLLMLKSSMNENSGPSVYVCPDKYLTKQAFEEATRLGIQVTDDANSIRFLKGKEVLITNIHKVINGKSVFGVGKKSIPIKNLLIDDAHACISYAEEQFRLTIPRTSEIGKRLFSEFIGEIYKQSRSKAQALEANDPTATALVPFWAWQEKNADVVKILYEGKDTEDLKFNFPLLKEIIHLCSCVISDKYLEISPRCLPIHVIPSFSDADRKIFMTATLSDDSILVKDFDLDIPEDSTVIAPENANDLGERLIVCINEIFPDVSDEDIKTYLKKHSLHYNIVVIVPSNRRIEYWRDSADLILTAENIHEGIDRLRKEHVGLTIIANRYDGIDLPDNACRILVIDGLPDIRSQFDKIEQSYFDGCVDVQPKQIQKIEQGMGRGVRSNSDYCVVLLMGRSLTSMLFSEGGANYLSAATKCQMNISDAVSGQLYKMELDQLDDAINAVLKRNPAWVKPAKEALSDVAYKKEMTINPRMLSIRKAFNDSNESNYKGACDALQEAIDEEKNAKIRGWLKYQMAEAKCFNDKVESQVILKSAKADNRYVITPLDGIEYKRIPTDNFNQANQCKAFIEANVKDANALIVRINGLTEALGFEKDNWNTFENALKEIGNLLGFKGQRPEKETGIGPDVLWGVGNLKYYVLECKSGAEISYIPKSDTEQLLNSGNWFKNFYDGTCQSIPVIIHPANLFSKDSFPDLATRVIDSEKLAELKAGLSSFFKSIATNGNWKDEKKIIAALESNSLTGKLFLQKYSKAMKKVN